MWLKYSSYGIFRIIESEKIIHPFHPILNCKFDKTVNFHNSKRSFFDFLQKIQIIKS